MGLARACGYRYLGERADVSFVKRACNWAAGAGTGIGIGIGIGMGAGTGIGTGRRAGPGGS